MNKRGNNNHEYINTAVQRFGVGTNVFESLLTKALFLYLTAIW